MARKTAIPSQQLDRLKVLYNQERAALVALAKAQDGVGNAEEEVAAAQRALEKAQSGVDAAYQALVALVGTGVAAELTGRAKSVKRSSRTAAPVAHAQEDARRHQVSEREEDGRDAPPAAVGAVVA